MLSSAFVLFLVTHMKAVRQIRRLSLRDLPIYLYIASTYMRDSRYDEPFKRKAARNRFKERARHHCYG